MPDEDYSTNLEALGRFKPGYVSWAEGETGSLDVLLSTNLAGEPIRFTMNESLDNIVSSATLTMLNAIIENDSQEDGVMSETHTEEDEAKWGTLYGDPTIGQGATVEPNQLVTVTESGGPLLGTCTTYWRVVGVTAYIDENEVPYYDVQLEGMGQIAIDTKFDPSTVVKDSGTAMFVQKSYYDRFMFLHQLDANEDGYVTKEEEEEYEAEEKNPIISKKLTKVRYIVATPQDWIKPFIDQISAGGLDCGAGIEGITIVPLECKYKKGESCWQIIVDILGLAGRIPRFNRAGKLITLNTDTGIWSFAPNGFGENGAPIYGEGEDGNPLEDTDIGNFGSGIQLSYSKEGVCNQATVSAYLVHQDKDGYWVPNSILPSEVTVVSQAGTNILNGEIVDMVVQVDERYLLQSEEPLAKFGQKELYKTIIGAKSATYDSETVPLNVEVGMTITGSSKLGGTTTIFITALSRTTDAQQNKIRTSISGTRGGSGISGSSGISGTESSTNNDLTSWNKIGWI